MNWLVFLLVLWVSAGLELGLVGVLQIGSLPIAPSALILLLAFIALWARPADLIVASLVIGLLIDALNQTPTAMGDHVAIFGPHALGAVLMARIALVVRGAMYRQGIITLAITTLLVGLGMHLVALALLVIRASYDVVLTSSLASEFATRGASALFTAILAIPLGFLIQRFLKPIMGFRVTHSLAPSVSPR